MEKVRQHDTEITTRWRVYNQDGTFLFDGERDRTLISRLDYISSGVGGAENNCLHIRRRNNFSRPSYTFGFQGGTGPVGDQWHYSDVDPEGPFEVPIGDIWTYVPPGFVGRSYQNCRPKLEADISVPNFVIELRELRGLFANVWSSYLRNVVSRRTKAVDKFYSDSLLASQYGYNPLFGDLGTLSTALMHYDAEVAKFNREANKQQRAHYRESYTYPEREVHMDYPDHSRWGYKTSPHEILVCSTIKYRYLIGATRASFLDPVRFFGFRRGNLPRVFWDALPFSFVMDWVLKVGDFLSQFDEGSIPVQLTLDSYLISVKFEAKSQIYAEKLRSGNWMRPPYLDLGTSELRYYNRAWMDPSLVAEAPVLPKIDGLSIRELVLGAALINSNKR